VLGTTCRGAIDTYVPNMEYPDNRIKYSCGPVECCKQLFTTCINDGPCDLSLQNPEVRARIDEIAKTSEVLVANCKGRYALYAPPSERTVNLDRVLEDRVLR